MACVIDSTSTFPENTLFLVYDLEAVGDVSEPSNCRLWNIASVLLHLNKGDRHISDTFNRFCSLAHSDIPPKPPSPELFPVSVDFLTRMNALPTASVLQDWFEWVNTHLKSIHTQICAETQPHVVLISHGNFRFDKSLLENECMRAQIDLPPTWYFMDSLLWFRRLWKRPSFRLCDLYRERIGKPIENAHFALTDANALRELIWSLNEEYRTDFTPLTVVYPPYWTPLQNVPGVGNALELLLIQKQILSVEHLTLAYVHACQFSIESFQHWLHHQIGMMQSSAQMVAQYVMKTC